MKTILLRSRAVCALVLMLVVAGCSTSDQFAGRPAPRRTLPQFGYSRAALPTVAVIVTCTDGPMTAAETNEVLSFMGQYFARHDKVLIDNPLRADYIARVVVARNGATQVSGWTLVSATYRKNNLNDDYYAALWGDDFNWRRACASFRYGTGYGYGFSGFGYDDFYPYGFGYGDTCYYPSTPVYTAPTRPICPTLPTYCARPPINHPRPTTCPPAPYCPRVRPTDTSVVQTHPDRLPVDRLVYVSGSGTPVSSGNGYDRGGYASNNRPAASRIYDSPQPTYSRSESRSSNLEAPSYSSNYRNYDSPSPSYSPSSSYSSPSSDLHVVSAPSQTYSSPEPSISRSEPSPSYSAPSAPVTQAAAN